MEDLKSGRTPDGQSLDGLIVYDIDRLTRDNRHLEDAIDVVERHRRPIIDINGSLDLLTENGRATARVVVAMSNKQSADTARRVRRKHRALEREGIPTGGSAAVRLAGRQADPAPDRIEAPAGSGTWHPRGCSGTCLPSPLERDRGDDAARKHVESHQAQDGAA
ncbi:recombinase family protein [Streptomyces sp. NPDC086519]|uniref:recombinase family protein n=1 Tax=Streptomyces sp. NPDC086519 TaxID=3154863 RepID=UPI0034454248